MFNLLAAIVWLALALLFLVGAQWSPEIRRLALSFRFNPGWAALVLAIYNTFRWASILALRRTRRLASEAARHPAKPVEPDPALDLRDAPAVDPNSRPDTGV